MDDNPHLRSSSEDLGGLPGPMFRRLLGQDPASSRLLGPVAFIDNNEQSSFQPHSSAAREDLGYGLSNQDEATKKQAHHGYEHVDTVDRSDAHSDRVCWKGISVSALTWELLGIIISILFLTLGACVTSLRGETESEWSKRILQVTRIAPSVWPILFSGVLGNAVRRFANWRAERGARLLALEQLMNSLTMAGTVLSVFNWSIFQWSSVVLIGLWAFNPLGSQASFRGIYLTDSLSHGVGQISHFDYNLTTQKSLASIFEVGYTDTGPTFRALYSAAVYGATSNVQYVGKGNATFEKAIIALGGSEAAGVQAATDSWGNIRVPNVEYLADFDPVHPTEWISTPWRKQLQNYSSLVGDRFDGLDRSFLGNTTFNLTSSYQSLNCSQWTKLDYAQKEAWAMRNFGQNYSSVMSSDISAPDLIPGKSVTDTRSFVGLASTIQPPFSNHSTPGSPRFIFLSRGNIASVTSCETSTTYVDVQVSCTSKGALGRADCGADAVRKIPQPAGVINPGFLDTLRINGSGQAQEWQIFQARKFLAAFTDLLDDNQRRGGMTSVVERYLADPLSAFDGTGAMTGLTLADVDIKIVEKRLSLLYNTLWKVGWSFESMTGGSIPTEHMLNVTSNTVRPLPQTYALDVPWLVLYFFSVGVMFLAAVASLVLHAMCNAPPILGYVSSLIRDSVFFSESGVQGNSTEDGSSKTSRLGKMEVKIADVWSEESVGRVAFAPAQKRGSVKKERWYD